MLLLLFRFVLFAPTFWNMYGVCLYEDVMTSSLKLREKRYITLWKVVLLLGFLIFGNFRKEKMVHKLKLKRLKEKKH